MNNFLIQKFTLQRSTTSLMPQNYSIVEVIHLLIGFNKTTSLLRNTKNSGGNCINGQNTHTHTHTHTHREREREEDINGYKRLVSVSDPPPLHPLVVGKFRSSTPLLPYLFGNIFENSSLPSL